MFVTPILQTAAMFMTAPTTRGASPVISPSEPHAASPSMMTGSHGTPLAGPGLLERLRMTGRARPQADPSLAAELGAGIDSGLAAVGLSADGLPALEQRLALEWAPGTSDTPADPFATGHRDRLVVTPTRLRRALICARHRELTAPSARPLTVAMACGALVDVLFRQLVTTGAIGDPIEDGMAALAIDDYQAPLVAWINDLSESERGGLMTEVCRQSEDLLARWPTFDPAWMPRTKDVLRAGLAGGAVELMTRVDLVIGRPAASEGSVALVDVISGPRRLEHRADRHLEALVETLRTGASPFAAATYYTQTGELDVDPVSPEILVAASQRLLAGMSALVSQVLGRPVAGYRAGETLPLGDGCPACAAEPLAALARTTDAFGWMTVLGEGEGLADRPQQVTDPVHHPYVGLSDDITRAPQFRHEVAA